MATRIPIIIALSGFCLALMPRSLRRPGVFPVLILCCLGSARVASAQFGPTWTSIGPDGGTVLSLAVDPPAPSIVYAGTNGGIFQSAEGEATWNYAISRTDQHQRPRAGDRTRDATTLYAGTVGGGAFKSTNGGGSWGAVN